MHKGQFRVAKRTQKDYSLAFPLWDETNKQDGVDNPGFRNKYFHYNSRCQLALFQIVDIRLAGLAQKQNEGFRGMGINAFWAPLRTYLTRRGADPYFWSAPRLILSQTN